MNTTVSPFRKYHRTDGELVGGKIANLGELLNAGFNVPDGFVGIDAQQYQHLIAETGIKDKISELLDGIDPANLALVRERSEQIKQFILQLQLPVALQRSIREAYRTLAPGNESVAVRSSATAEDQPDASFAGQQETYLNITGADHVVRAVLACVASLFEHRAVA